MKMLLEVTDRDNNLRTSFRIEDIRSIHEADNGQAVLYTFKNEQPLYCQESYQEIKDNFEACYMDESY